jgi:mRNA interferase RelE/StbE
MADGYLLRVPESLVVLIRNLHPLLKVDIRAGLQLLLQNPESGKALKEELQGLRSFRIKRYRIIYRIVVAEKILEIIALGPRKSIYEETYRILSQKGKERMK